MIKGVLALLGILASSQAQAAGETLPSFGLSPGASPNQVCIFDLSATRPCVTMGTLDSTAHTFSSSPVSIIVGPGGSGSTSITQSGTGNLTVTLGGPSSILDWRNSGGTSLMQLQSVGGPGGMPSLTMLTQMNLQHNSVVSGANPAMAAGINMNRGFTGSPTGTGAIVLGASLVATDSVDASGTGVGSPVELVRAQMTSSSASEKGTPRVGDFSFILSGPSGNASGQYIALSTLCALNSSDNGTALDATNSAGICFGANLQVSASGQNLRGIAGEEIDMTVNAGSSVLDVNGEQIFWATSGTPGTVGRDSAGLAIASQSATVGFKYGIQFGNYNAPSIVGSTGTLIYANGHTDSGGFAGAGVDFSQITFVNFAWKSVGAQIDPTGIITGASYKAGATVGVTCAGSPTASFASTGGIVTHC